MNATTKDTARDEARDKAKSGGPPAYEQLFPVYAINVHSVPYDCKTPVVYVVQPPDAKHVTPNHFLAVSAVLMAILTFVFPPSLVLTIPALKLSLMSRSASREGRLLKAKKLGNVALALNMFAVVLSLTAVIVLVAVLLKIRQRTYWNDIVFPPCYQEYYGSGYGSAIICY